MAANAQELVMESVERWWRMMEDIRVVNNQKMQSWYLNDKTEIDKMIKAAMRKIFSQKTIKKMNVRMFNIVPRVVDKLGLVYKYPPQRVLDGGIKYSIDKTTKEQKKEQTKDDERYQEMISASTIGMKQGQWQKLAKLFNTVLVQPVWMDEGDKKYMDYRIHTPAWTVVNPRKDNYLKAESLYYPIWKVVNGVYQQVLVYWSDTDHFLVDRNGNKFAQADTNKEMKNPYGKLPFVTLRMKEGPDYWGEGMWDLIDGSEEICIQLTNLYYVSIFQAHGQAVAINMQLKGAPITGPDCPIVSENAKQGDVPPSFEFKNPNPNLKAVQDLIDWTVKTVQMLRGLGPQQYALEAKIASGVSKVVDSTELEEIREDDSAILLPFEQELHDKTIMVYNYENSGRQISPTAKFSIKFGEKQVVKDAATRSQERREKLDLNIASRVDFIMEDNPGMTREDAQKKLEDILAENERFKDGFTMFDNQKSNKDSNADKVDELIVDEKV